MFESFFKKIKNKRDIIQKLKYKQKIAKIKEMKKNGKNNK